MKKKKIPLRKCVSCGEQKEKYKLVRVVDNKEEGVLLDITGKKNGRGAYICKSVNCVDRLLKTKRLNSVLGKDVDKEFYENLKEYIYSIEE